MAKRRYRPTNVALKKGWKVKALEALRTGATIAEAAQAANVARVTLYRAPESDPEFKVAMQEAIEEGTDVIEAAATRRAVVGVEEPVIYQGQMTFVGIDANGDACDPQSKIAVRNIPLTVRKPSDVLAIFLLKGRRPEKFRDNAVVTHQGPNGGPMEVKSTVDLSSFSDDELERIARAFTGGRVGTNAES